MRGLTSHCHGKRDQRRRRRTKHLRPLVPVPNPCPTRAKPVRAVYGRSPVEQITRQIEKIVAGTMILDPLEALAGSFSIAGVPARLEMGDGEVSFVPDLAKSMSDAAELSRLFDPPGGILIPVKAKKPEIGPNQYQCTMCRGIFDKGPEDEALAELELEFPGFTPAECGLVCDDCFKMVMGE